MQYKNIAFTKQLIEIISSRPKNELLAAAKSLVSARSNSLFVFDLHGHIFNHHSATSSQINKTKIFKDTSAYIPKLLHNINPFSNEDPLDHFSNYSRTLFFSLEANLQNWFSFYKTVFGSYCTPIVSPITLDLEKAWHGTPERSNLEQMQDTYNIARKYLGQVLPVYSIDPNREAADFLEQLKTAMNSMAVKLKFYNSLFGVPASDFTIFAPQYAALEKTGYPIVTHVSNTGIFTFQLFRKYYEFYIDEQHRTNFTANKRLFGPINIPYIMKSWQWLNAAGHWDIVLNNYPELNICFSHCGGKSSIDRFYKEFLRNGRDLHKTINEKNSDLAYLLFFAREFKNVYLDFSYEIANKHLPALINAFMNRYPDKSHKWLPGFDHPLILQKGSEVDILSNAIMHFGSKRTEKIFQDNPLDHLGLR